MIATILAVLVILFMILPIFILYPISFSPTSYIVFPNEGFSTQWYEKLFSDPLWAQAVQNSIVIAIFTTILSLLLGTIAAVCMNRFSHKWKTVLGEYFSSEFRSKPVYGIFPCHTADAEIFDTICYVICVSDIV